MNIKQRLKKIHYFNIKPDFSKLNSDQLKAIDKCIQASEIITDIYLTQKYSKNHQIIEDLKNNRYTDSDLLLKYFMIQGSPWDSYHHNQPFIPEIGKQPKFGSFYPSGLTVKEWHNWLSNHPEDYQDFENNYNVIKRQNNKLLAVPYAEEYKDKLQQASKLLTHAATHLKKGHLKTFLNKRANAFIENNYYDSDLKWVDTDGHPFEVTIGPYEVYFDNLLGLKAAFESFIALPDKESTTALSKFSPYVPEFDKILSREFKFNPKGSAIPLEVVNDVTRGGEARFGYMFVAYNLPNNRKIHQLKGSKKVFSRTMMEAKFTALAEPIADLLLTQEDRKSYTFHNRLLFVLAHELAHGIGPSQVKINNRMIPFETALKDLHSTIEEAKADMLGVKLLHFFYTKKLISEQTMQGIINSIVPSFFQGWRHGFEEAHARGNLIQYNWLKANHAIKFETHKQKFEVNYQKCTQSMIQLSSEFIRLQQQGNYQIAKNFLQHWGKIPSELPKIIKKFDHIPIAVSPKWDHSELSEKLQS